MATGSDGSAAVLWLALCLAGTPCWLPGSVSAHRGQGPRGAGSWYSVQVWFLDSVLAARALCWAGYGYGYGYALGPNPVLPISLCIMYVRSPASVLSSYNYDWVDLV